MNVVEVGLILFAVDLTLIGVVVVLRYVGYC